jgi:hypothetical protein
MNDPDFSAIDLETMTGAGLHNWQKQTFDTMYGGFKRGEMMTFAAGRGTGKSMLTAAMLDNLCKEMAMLTPPFEVLSTADVDGAPWYTVSCRKEVSIWVRENGEEDKEWYSHIDSRWTLHRNVFDMSQEMFAMTKLRWGE